MRKHLIHIQWLNSMIADSVGNGIVSTVAICAAAVDFLCLVQRLKPEMIV